MEEVKLAPDATHSVSLDEVALHREDDLEQGGKNKKSMPENDVVDDTNGSPDGNLKAAKSVKWSEQLVSESTYTPSIEPDSSPYSHSSAGSNPYVSHSSTPSLPDAPSFKGLALIIIIIVNVIVIEF